MGSASNQVMRLRDRLPADVSGQVTDSLSRIADQLTDVAQDWSSKARAAAKSTDAFVRSSPWQALGVVALVSLAAGVLAARQARAARFRRQADYVQQELAGG